VAEEIVLGDISTGAHNDFQRATAIARSMITEYGMSRLGPMQFGKSQGQVFLGRDYGSERNYSDQIAYEIDQEMQNIINECYAKCTELLTTHRDKLDLIANTLLRVETLDAEQIKQLIETGEMVIEPQDTKDVIVNIQPKQEQVQEQAQEPAQDETNEEPKQ